MSSTFPLPPSALPRISLIPALEVLAELRTDEIVVTSMGALREWSKFSKHPLDFQYFPSSMGQLPALCLGLALAQPKRQVIGLVGDGSLLMNLGCLATIRSSEATNLTLILFDNGVYEVTGGQKTAGGLAQVDYAAVARDCRWSSVVGYNDLQTWKKSARESLALPGPRFIALKVEPVRENYEMPSATSAAQRIANFRAALSTA